jgi:2-oxoglutarate/2-oxoacid ferredoxin oxidoreductase subunit beta
MARVDLDRPHDLSRSPDLGRPLDMDRSPTADYRSYLRTEAFPTFWCPGCGNGVIISALVRALSDRGIPPHRTVAVTGIGCFGKADDYLKTHALHGTHGRALGFATGVKAARPELTVVALMGDGDSATIGGNHLIHACRRDIGVLAIVSNNLNYGMTGGQLSATTPHGKLTSTSPLGHVEEAFDLCGLAGAAGAGFVARVTPAHPVLMRRVFHQALGRPGFSFVEVMTTCPTHYGRANKLGDPAAMLQALADQYRGGLGVLVDRATPGFSARYAEVQARAAAAGAASRAGDSK